MIIMKVCGLPEI